MLNLDKAICRLGKISNNLEKHGDDDVTEFNIPVSGVTLTAEEWNAFIGDPHCDRSWFNTTRGNVREPMPWWSRGSFYLDDKLDAQVCVIGVSGDRELEFKPEKELPACTISKIRPQPLVGGTVGISFQLQIRPGIGDENLLLQEHQNREIRLTISKSAAAKARAKQGELALPAGGKVNGDSEDAGQKQDRRMRAQTAEKLSRARRAGPRKGGAKRASAH